MTLTSKLGTSDSVFGNVFLGGGELVSNFVNASNTIVFTQSVSTAGGVMQRSVSNTLSFSQIAVGVNPNQRITQTITFSQSLQGDTQLSRSLSDTLYFVAAASCQQIRPASNTITFSQSVTVNKYKGVYSALALTQTLTSQYNPHTEPVAQTFLISQSAIGALILTRQITHTLALTHSVTVTRVKSRSVTTPIVFQNTATISKIGIINQSFVISQSAIVHRIINPIVVQSLQLLQSLQRNVIYVRAVSNQLLFKNTHDKITEIGGNTEIISLPDVIVTKPQALVILKTPGYILTLEEPKFDDTEGGLSKLIQKRMVNGDMFTYVRKLTSRKLHYVFEIGRNKALETRQYILDYLSTPMYLENWKGEVWYGYIVNNPFSIQAKRRSVPCDIETSEIEVEFEGVRIH